MPFISTKTTTVITEEKEERLKQRLGKAIECIPGKIESWLMLSFEDRSRMYFKGKNESDMAFIEVKIFGSASDAAYDALTKEITTIYAEELGIQPGQIYIKYEEIAHWGWNGANF